MNSDQFNIFRIGAVLALALMWSTADISAAPPVNPPEDFVRASVVVTGPGESLYSCAGHAFIRMQCPSEKMDYCFSYESEEISNRVLAFLGGKLKMGMAVVPTEQFISSYRDEGRRVTEYALNLPISVKQNLWRVLDNSVDQGMDLPYDYLERGCAISVLHFIEEALGYEPLEIHELPPVFNKSRREILSSELDEAPWTRVAINVLTNGSANEEVEDKEKAITPTTLVELLKNSHVKGVPVISAAPNELAPESRQIKAGFFSPTVLGILILALTLLSVVSGHGIMIRLLVGIQLLLGLVNVYLIFFSNLCGTEWSWLLIPFNPLPAIFWRWRAKWELPYAAAIVVWCVAMLFSSKSMTDPLFVTISVSIAISYTADRLIPDGMTRSTFDTLCIKPITNIISKLKPVQL